MDHLLLNCYSSYKTLKNSKDFDPNFTKMAWKFSSRKGWISMDIVASYQLEKALFENKKNLFIFIGTINFLFDLENCTQINTQTGNKRLIRRCSHFSDFVKVLREDLVEERDSEDLWIAVKDPDSVSLEEKCSLCLDTLFEGVKEVGRLKRCKGHFFHKKCDDGMDILKYIKRFGKCPVCREHYRRMEGRRPPGDMLIKCLPRPLRGFSCGEVWVMKFVFPSGVQTEKHENPGERYHGETRTAFLPNTSEGISVLVRFVRAWRQKLLFSVGHSLTRQSSNVIIFDGVHMKTSLKPGPHGYPDKGYLERVSEELSSIGIK